MDEEARKRPSEPPSTKTEAWEESPAGEAPKVGAPPVGESAQGPDQGEEGLQGAPAVYTEEQVRGLVAQREAELQRHFQTLKDREVAGWQSAAMQAQSIVAELHARLQQTQEEYEGTMAPDQRLERRLKRLEHTMAGLSSDSALRGDSSLRGPAARGPGEAPPPAGPFGPSGPTPELSQPAPLLPMLQAVLKTEGLDPEDPAIDWAPELQDPYQGLARWARSVARLVEKRSDQKAESALARLRKELGVDAVDTQGPSAAGAPNIGARTTPREAIKAAWGN